jgi:hypothetical protein
MLAREARIGPNCPIREEIGMTDAEPTPLAARHRSLLALHGAAGVLVGLLGGLAFLFNILRFIEIFPFVPRIQKQVPGTEAAWRAAHTGPIMNGMLAMGVSASGSMIELTPRAQRSLVAAMIVTLWGNVVGYNAAASADSPSRRSAQQGGVLWFPGGGDQRARRCPADDHRLAASPARRGSAVGTGRGERLTRRGKRACRGRSLRPRRRLRARDRFGDVWMVGAETTGADADDGI